MRGKETLGTCACVSQSLLGPFSSGLFSSSAERPVTRAPAGSGSGWVRMGRTGDSGSGSGRAPLGRTGDPGSGSGRVPVGRTGDPGSGSGWVPVGCTGDPGSGSGRAPVGRTGDLGRVPEGCACDSGRRTPGARAHG